MKGSLSDALADFRKFAELSPKDTDGPAAVARVEGKIKGGGR
jgi:hypothetical protein